MLNSHIKQVLTKYFEGGAKEIAQVLRALMAFPVAANLTFITTLQFIIVCPVTDTLVWAPRALNTCGLNVPKDKNPIYIFLKKKILVKSQT